MYDNYCDETGELHEEIVQLLLVTTQTWSLSKILNKEGVRR